MEIGNRRLRYEDGKFYSRAIRYGKETKKEIWNEITFSPNRGYLIFNIKINNKYRSIAYHRLVYKFHHPDWDMEDSSTNNSIDHKNGNTQDNRIENLRCVTHQENQWNQTKAKGYSKSPSGSYLAKIKVNNKTIHLGTYKTEEEAHEAYLKGKEKYHVIQSH